MNNKLTAAQLQQIQRIYEILKNMNCEFRIRTPEGHGFDNIFIHNRGTGALSLNATAKPKKSKQTQMMREHGIRHGDIKAYLDGQLKDIKVGEVRVIPLGKFDFLGGKFASHIAGHACNTFGAGMVSVSWDSADRSFLFHYHGGI